MMTRTIEDIYTYRKQAYDLIPNNHPHKEEIRRLLIDQVNDELHDYESTTGSDRRADAA
mgnify:CR=1 FL=1